MSLRASRRKVLMGGTMMCAAAATAAVTKFAIANGTVKLTDFGAMGDGKSDCTAAFEKAVQSGASVIMVPAGVYRIRRQIAIASAVMLEGANGAKIVLDLGGFDETNASNSYASSACALLFRNVTGGGVRGLNFAPDRYEAESVAMAIALRGCSGTFIENCEFDGFSKSKIVRIDSGNACRVSGNYFHDCCLDSAANAQLTCVDVDDNRLGKGSNNLQITGNTFNYITASSRFREKFGCQTDAINISHESSSGHFISDNRADDVGEGVDCFGSDCIIRNNYLINCRNYGVKLVHGASRNLVSNNTIMRPGLGGIVLGGNSSDVHNTERNTVINNNISQVGYDGAWAGSATFGIKLEDDHGGRRAQNNVIKENTISQGSRMDFGIISADSSCGNSIINNSVENFVRKSYISSIPDPQSFRSSADPR